ncbi:CwfJ C-terminus 2-domain-containing protein-like protein [Podospora didyma]|uniref:CwfJ C-terminus 2-domain-containing protein-like protein n=1 Tax=Podospora didyma TaxID=330526 RepID=A0AAE0U755_9PEZI|nr:CwfJ C-terminus 2-domain-containing protein-like protein [Podospora didyma]
MSAAMAMSDAVKAKILVVGSVDGKIRAAFAKIGSLHAKNAFAFAIVTGNLFGAEDSTDGDEVDALLEGQIDVPIRVYFTMGTAPLPSRVLQLIEDRKLQIAPNVWYLEKQSMFTTPEGVNFFVKGGIEDSTPSHDPKSLMAAGKADILLSAEWPLGILNQSAKTTDPQVLAVTGSAAVRDLCVATRPQYHLAPSPGPFFEREPFSYDVSTGARGVDVTRFISLAPFGNTKKEKALYAFTLKASPPVTRPDDCTRSPFPKTAPKSLKRDAKEAGYSSHPGGNRRHKHRHHEQPSEDQCFFCMASNNFSAHMVPSIANVSYLATAKGPLPTSGTFTEYGLDLPCHMIIAPIEHTPSIGRGFVKDESGAQALFDEMEQYREALQTLFAAGSGRKLGAVTWEINRASNVHAHWQIMPIPAEKAAGGVVEAAFQVAAADDGLGQFRAAKFCTADEMRGTDYLRVWVWYEGEDGKTVETSLVLEFDDRVRFNLQFPRVVMAKLLELEQRVSWKAVTQTQEEETADVEAFKQGFKEWDFAMM